MDIHLNETELISNDVNLYGFTNKEKELFLDNWEKVKNIMEEVKSYYIKKKLEN